MQGASVVQTSTRWQPRPQLQHVVYGPRLQREMHAIGAWRDVDTTASMMGVQLGIVAAMPPLPDAASAPQATTD